MNVAQLFGPDWIPLWISGFAMVGLALALFALDMANRAQRIFALLLALRGLTFFIGPIRFEAATLAQQVMWTQLAGYLVLPLVPLVLYFLSVYPRPRGLAKTRAGPWIFLLATCASLLWYLVDHSAYATVGDRPQVYSDYGPLFILAGLRGPAFAFAGLFLALSYRTSPTGSKGFSLFLVVAAFTLNGLFDGTLALLDMIEAIDEPATVWGMFGWADHILPVAALPLGIASCLALLPVVFRAKVDLELQEVSRFMLVAVPLAIASPFVVLLESDRAQDLATFVLGIWRLFIPFLVAYALMRFQLFDLDLRLKAGVRRGIILASFAVTFFMVSEAAEELASQDRGPLFGIAAAGFLALGSRPVHSFADHAAERFMPDTKPIGQQTHLERLRFYLDQFALINQDGTVTPKERRMLDKLRRTLSLSHMDAEAIERNGRVPEKAANPKPTRARRKVDGLQDSRLELAVKGALVAGTIALVFGTASEGIESILPISTRLAGLIAAAVVALALGPLENLADRLTHRLDPRAATEAKDEARRRKAFEAALTEALADGHLSARDLDYLASLQERLRIPRALRWRLERRIARRMHVKIPLQRPATT